MIRLMVQGDRVANKGVQADLEKLGKICLQKGIGLNVGEAGEIVQLLTTASGASVRVHQTKAEKPNNVVPNSSFQKVNVCISAAHAVAEIAEHYNSRRLTGKTTGWALRLAVMLDSSDGFIFFPGREGTMAHLIPAMAFIAKGERDKGAPRPRRVALIGWNPDQVTALYTLFSIKAEKDGWIQPFSLDNIAAAIDWLTDGLNVE